MSLASGKCPVSWQNSPRGRPLIRTILSHIAKLFKIIQQQSGIILTVDNLDRDHGHPGRRRKWFEDLLVRGTSAAGAISKTKTSYQRHDGTNLPIDLYSREASRYNYDEYFSKVLSRDSFQRYPAGIDTQVLRGRLRQLRVVILLTGKQALRPPPAPGCRANERLFDNHGVGSETGAGPNPGSTGSGPTPGITASEPRQFSWTWADFPGGGALIR